MTPSEGLAALLAQLAVFDLSEAQAALVPIAIVLGYVVYGLTGFGATLASGVLLAHVFPLKFIVPMHSLLDVSGALLIGRKLSAEADFREVRWLLPFMLIGMALGLTLLVNLPPRASMLLLGVFVLGYGLLSIFGRTPALGASRWWGLPLGLIGGTFSALFGTGGPLYLIYLSRRIEDVKVVRSTVTVLISVAAFVRVGMFALAGLYGSREIWIVYLIGLPFLAIGIYLGRRLHRWLTPERVRQAIYLLLIVSGVSLLGRALS